MQSSVMKFKPDTLAADISRLSVTDPNLLIVMGGTDLLKNGDVYTALRSKFPKANIAGCSTSGEIGEKGVSDGGIEVAALRFDKGRTKTVSFPISDASQSRSVGEQVTAALQAPDLKAIFVLAPGTNVNGSDLVKGLSVHLAPGVVLTGGLAGDGTRFQETRIISNDGVHPHNLVAVGFYGDSLQVGSGSKGGWKPFGPPRTVTKVDGNVLYELDGKPALELYKHYLGEQAKDLPASGLYYPFAILNEDRSTGLIRTILNVDHEKQSLILAGDIPPGSQVCLMHADRDDLAEGARLAAEDAKAAHMAATGDALTICVSCVGRRLVMGEDVDDEIDSARDVLKAKNNMIGFYSYGEIAPFTETARPELHNQTMTITHIRENA